MAFMCTQNWDAMKVTETGRYCDSCKKNVTDYRQKSIAEVNQLDKGACGIFLPEQVEEGLTPIEFKFVSQTKYYAAALATVFGLEIRSLKAQETNAKQATEFVASDTVKINSFVLYASSDSTEAGDDDADKNDPVADKKPFLKSGRRNYYWINKFPFITSRRRFRMGAKF